MADNARGVDKVADLIKDIKTCMLTTTTEDGALLSRPMVVQQVRFAGDLWFVTDGDSSKIAQIRHGDQVNAAFAADDTWVSVTGTAEVTHDDAKARELWNTSLDSWFPGGPQTPGLTLIKVHAASAQYWDMPFDNPVGVVSSLVKLATGKVRGERPDIGEHETVVLGPDTSPGN